MQHILEYKNLDNIDFTADHCRYIANLKVNTSYTEKR